jgi:hypothetical protein
MLNGAQPRRLRTGLHQAFTDNHGIINFNSGTIQNGPPIVLEALGRHLTWAVSPKDSS